MLLSLRLTARSITALPPESKFWYNNSSKLATRAALVYEENSSLRRIRVHFHQFTFVDWSPQVAEDRGAALISWFSSIESRLHVLYPVVIPVDFDGNRHLPVVSDAFLLPDLFWFQTSTSAS